MLFVKTENGYKPADRETIVKEAIRPYHEREETITSPIASKAYGRIMLSGRESEVFAVLFLDNRHGIIEFEELFRGTIDACSVYIREIVKRAMVHNAAAVILYHNHPSGIPDPSFADQTLTGKIKTALSYIDVRVLDHIIVGHSCYSMAENGLV